MSETDFPPIEPEVVLLRAEAIKLRAENNDLREKYAEARNEQKWLIRVLVFLFLVVVALIGALILEKRSGAKKSHAKELGESTGTARGGSLKRIIRLLKDLFEEEEVRRFVHTHLGAAGEAVIHGLGSHTSPDDLFHKIAVALAHHGLVGEILFNALLEIRPLQRDYILQVRAKCGIAEDEDEEPAAE